MAQRTWHPYAPDQAFGQRAARDEELVNQILAGLDMAVPAEPVTSATALEAAPFLMLEDGAL